MNSELFYFGCIRQAGHYLWINERQNVWDSSKLGINERLCSALDGAFCPSDMTEGQRWVCSSVPPWTIVAWWDRSVDSRPNCVSVFIAKGFDGEPHRLLDVAKEIFPSVFLRQPRELKEYASAESK